MFQCSSASRKFLNSATSSYPLAHALQVSVLFSEPKIPQYVGYGVTYIDLAVSVLFSEPKIPQFDNLTLAAIMLSRFQCSSASRKFLNSSNENVLDESNAVFQCSSASRKFLNFTGFALSNGLRGSFSALQRAENSSILNSPVSTSAPGSFSALQRAENSSIKTDAIRRIFEPAVSVLFSEPKIPQSEHGSRARKLK